jgi:hypothetical protein
VTADGRIEEYRVAYEGTLDGAVVRGEATIWYAAVGETSVEALEWLDGVDLRNGTDEGNTVRAAEVDAEETGEGTTAEASEATQTTQDS